MTARKRDQQEAIQPRSIDHCVLPTENLATARARLTALGFTVAPDGVHPFGTANCCVYLAGGTFIEPIAIVEPAKAREAAASGKNVFALHDREGRLRRGEEGFSALVFATDHASADHRAFEAAGCSAGPILKFSRPFVDAEGKSDRASFKLAFAAEPRAPSTLFFTCERLSSPKVDRSVLQRHANGATGIARVVISENTPSDLAAFVASVIGAPVPADPTDGALLHAANGEVELVPSDKFQQRYGIPPDADQPLSFGAIVFSCPDVDAVAELLDGASVMFRRRDRSLLVPMVPGQGAIFAFEESR